LVRREESLMVGNLTSQGTSKTWLELHSASESAAIEAEQSLRSGDSSQAMLLYAMAAELEQQALAAVDPAKARTRGIMAVSAVSLWYKAVHYERAKQLAYSMLADPSLQQFARAELQNIVQAIEGSQLAALLAAGGQGELA
jgi:hypothetical protein